MKSATLRDLRYGFPRLESWLKEGESIEITKHGEPIAHLIPSPKKRAKLQKPDYLAQLKEVWGDKVFTKEEVEQMRQFESEGEEG